MTAGSGIWHSEKNKSKDADVHFIQMWIVPDTDRVDPGYEQMDINEHLAKGGLVPVASGMGHDSAISIQQRDAALWAARLTPGERVHVPDAAFAHVFVAKGSVDFEQQGALGTGDAVRMTAAGSPTITAGDDGAEVLIWQTGTLSR